MCLGLPLGSDNKEYPKIFSDAFPTIIFAAYVAATLSDKAQVVVGNSLSTFTPLYLKLRLYLNYPPPILSISFSSI